MTFAKGASLADPSGLFNSSLEGNTRRAIDFREGDKLDEEALKALIRAAVALNTAFSLGPLAVGVFAGVALLPPAPAVGQLEDAATGVALENPVDAAFPFGSHDRDPPGSRIAGGA